VVDGISEEGAEGTVEAGRGGSKKRTAGTAAPTKKPKKARKARIDGRSFLDDMAAIGDEDEEDEEYDDEGGFLDDDGVEAGRVDWAAAEAEALQRRASMRDAERILETAEDEDVARIAREIEERHADYGVDEEDWDVADAGAVEVDARARLPVATDPHLYMFCVKVGKEREVVLSIARKAADQRARGERPSVMSVVSLDHMKGYIWVEARSDKDALNAVGRMRFVERTWKRKMVPLDEMTSVVAAQRKRDPLKVGAFVRVNRGPYKGDLARVEAINEDETGRRIKIKMPARIDFDAADARARPGGSKLVQRPQRRLVTPDMLRERGVRFQAVRERGSMQRLYQVGSSLLDEQGYLVKTVSERVVEASPESVNATLEELKLFHADLGDETRGASASIDAVLAAAPRKLGKLERGDRIQVTVGEVKGLTGVVTRLVDAEQVEVLPDLAELRDTKLVLAVAELRKFFREGDHVKVIAGRQRDQTGMVAALSEDGDRVTIFSDLTNREFSALASDVRLSTDMSSGRIALGGYELLDLVHLGPAEVGVITSVEAEGFKVLSSTGDSKHVPLARMGQKRGKSRGGTLDVARNAVAVGDSVDVEDGPHKGKRATVLHIYRTSLFLRCRDDSSVVVVRPSQVRLPGARGSVVGGGAANLMSPRLAGGSLNGPGAAGGGGRDGQARGPGAGAGRRGRDALMNVTVKVSRGQWKGYVGFVKSATEDTVHVTLQTNGKTVKVPRLAVKVLEKGATSTVGRVGEGIGGFGAQGPAVGAATPMRGGNDLGFTPGRDFTAATPGREQSLWDPNRQTTPGSYFAGDVFGQEASSSIAPPVAPASAPPGAVPPPVAEPVAPAVTQLTNSRDEQFRPRFVVIVQGVEAVVASLDETSKSIVLEDGSNVSVEEAMLAEPVTNDQVFIFRGDYEGEDGELVGIDRSDAIVMHDSDLRIVNMKDIAKFSK